MTSSSSSTRAEPPQLTEEERAREDRWRANLEDAFEEGVELAFSRWEALKIATRQMGGPDVDEKVEEFIQTAVDWFLDEKDPLHWDEVEDWLADVLANEFHIDAQDGSPEQIARLLCTLHNDVMVRGDFAGMHRMFRMQSEVERAMREARRVGNAESERHEALVRAEEEAEDISEEGEDDEGDEAAEASRGVGSMSLAEYAAASSSSSAPRANEEPAEEKTAEQLADEADGWETVPKKGKKGKK